MMQKNDFAVTENNLKKVEWNEKKTKPQIAQNDFGKVIGLKKLSQQGSISILLTVNENKQQQ